MNDVDLSGLPDWHDDQPGIVAHFATGSFAAGVMLVNAIAPSAEDANHHPDIELTYPQVTVRLVTHDAGDRVTDLDTALAAQISRAAAELGVSAVSST